MFSIMFATLITLVIIGKISSAPTSSGSGPFKNNANPDITVILPKYKELTEFEQNSALFEGDIVPSPPTVARSLVRTGSTVRWTNGIVPYEISTSYSTADRTAILSAMRELENYVAINNIRCVQFRPRQGNDIYFIRIVNGSGCSSPVGQNTGVAMNRTVTLQTPGCIYNGIIIHELLHTLGFYHEQSRFDRDTFIQVNTANIQSNMLDQFTKYSTTDSNTQNISYDYHSVMHYPTNAFTANGLPTIVVRQANVKIGQRYFLSSSDIAAIRKFYGCSGIGTTLPPTTTTTTAPSTSVFISNYTSILNTADPFYTRPNGLTGSRYYYESIAVAIPSIGTYTFESRNILDTYISVYQNSFNLSNTSTNLLLQTDDQSSINWNFKFGLNVRSPLTVIAVISTYSPNAQGPFTFIVTGPSRVNFTRRSL